MAELTPEQRAGVEFTARVKRQRARAQLDEVLAAMDLGLDVDSAAADQGVTLAALERKAYRYGYRELAQAAARARPKRPDTRVWADRKARGSAWSGDGTGGKKYGPEGRIAS